METINFGEQLYMLFWNAWNVLLVSLSFGGGFHVLFSVICFSEPFIQKAEHLGMLNLNVIIFSKYTKHSIQQ
jgi:hypothetical protein